MNEQERKKIEEDLVEKYRCNNFVYKESGLFETRTEYTKLEKILLNRYEDKVKQLAYKEHERLEQIAEELFKNMEEEWTEWT